jgi:hypothetical protein
MGPPIHYYGDMNMAEDQDKNKEEEEFDIEKMVKDIIDDVFSDFDDSGDEEE